MLMVAEIDGAAVSTDDVIRHLNITGRLPQVVSEMVGVAAVAREAVRREIVVTPEELQAAADGFRRAAGLLQAEDVRKFFDTRGWRVEDFELNLGRDIVRARLREEIVPRERVEAWYREHKPGLRGIAVSRILVEKLDQASEILAQIRDGEIRFDDAARKYSREAATSPGGGFIGFLRLESLPPAMHGALHGAKAGDVLGPFEIPGGATLVKIEAVREAELTKELADEIAEKIFNEWLDERVKELNARVVRLESILDTAPGERRDDPEDGPPSPA